MAKEYKTQKKKTLTRTIANITFKILVGIAIILFAYIIYDKADFSTNKIAFSPKKNDRPVVDTPSQLKWFSDFKGIENIPNKSKKDQKHSENTGFRYEGFKK